MSYWNSAIVCPPAERSYQIIPPRTPDIEPDPAPRLSFVDGIKSKLERYLVGSKYFVAHNLDTFEGHLMFWDPNGSPEPSRMITVDTENGSTQRYEVFVDAVEYTLGTEPPPSITVIVKPIGKTQVETDTNKPVEVTANYANGGDYVWIILDFVPIAADDRFKIITKWELRHHLSSHNNVIPLSFYWSLLKSSIESGGTTVSNKCRQKCETECAEQSGDDPYAFGECMAECTQKCKEN